VYISGTPRRRAEVGSNRLLPAHRLLMKQVMSYWRVIDTDTCIRTADAATIVNIAGWGRGAGGGRGRGIASATTRRFHAFRVSRFAGIRLDAEFAFTRRQSFGGAAAAAAAAAAACGRGGGEGPPPSQNNNCSSGRP